MKVRIVTTGYREITATEISPVTEELLREAIAGDKWQIRDVTDSWRSDVDRTDSVTIYDDNGKVIWVGTF